MWMKEEVKKLIVSGFVILIGLVLLKYLPMWLYGSGILFDASAHIAIAIFILYFFWFFIDQNKNWRIPYFIFAFMVLTIISVQRIISNNHNDIGLLMGLVLGLVSIGVAEWKRIKNKFDF
jgi:hypothetical protein